MTSRNGMNLQLGPTAYLAERRGGISFATDALNGPGIGSFRIGGQ
jgi:hypothetical protein